MFRKLALILFLLAMSEGTWAYEAAVAHVTDLQSTYMPGNVQFQVDVGTASCPAGHWLTWANANTDNNKVTYATLLAAITSGSHILFQINDGDTSCTVVFMNIISG
jgi:hypothetical protein